MGKHDYDIDDILLEAQLLKQSRGEPEKRPAASAAPVVPQTTPVSQAKRGVRPPMPVPAPFVRGGTEPSPEPISPAPSAPSAPQPIPLAPPAAPKPQPIPPAVPAAPKIQPVQQPSGAGQPAAAVRTKTKTIVAPPEAETEDDVRIYTPGSQKEERSVPLVRPVGAIRLAHEDSPTRVVELSEDIRTVTKVTAPSPEKAAVEEMDGQLKMDEYVGEEQQEGESDEDWEGRLRKARQEKVSAFKLLRTDKEDGGFKLSGDDEEVNDPAEEPVIYEDEELEDYSSYEETEAVANELNYRRRTGWITLILTSVAECALVWLTLMSYLTGAPTMAPQIFLSVHAFLLLVMMLLNHRMVGGGLGNLFRFQADADSAVSAASLFALLHTLLLFFHTDAVSEGKAPLFASAAGLGLLFGAVGRQMRLGRIWENFRFVSYRGDKYAAHRVEDSQSAVEIGRSAVALGEPEVAYFKKADFLEHFLENSYGDDGSDRAMRLYVPLALLASALLGAGCFFLKKTDLWGALAVGVGTFCIASPVAALMASNFPLLRAAKKVLRRGAMLIGWDAVQEFGSLHAVAVDAQDLFPSESVLLHGIKTFSGARIDEALLDAAAVSIAAGGPLAGVFRRVIENKTDMLSPVDTLVYEQDMGLSGWVGGRRVLVGNRRLLENHGVDVPSRDYENRYAKGDRQLVYLSTAGELSAMFVVSYTADEGIAQSLHNLEKCGLTLLVRTCDPNVTENLICETFELDSYYVELMGVTAGRAYERLRSAKDSRNPEALLASNGRLEGMVTALTACRRLRSGVGLAVVAQIVGAALGFGLNLFLAFTTGLSLPPLYMLGYLLGWSILSWILPVFRKV